MDNETRDMFNLLLKEIKGIRSDVSCLQEDVGSLKTRFDNLETRFDSLETRFDSLETRFDSLENKVESLESQTIQNTSKLNDLQGLIETELRFNIQVIAEGHGMVYENVTHATKDALEAKKNEELHGIRLNMVEHKLDKLYDELKMKKVI